MLGTCASMTARLNLVVWLRYIRRISGRLTGSMIVSMIENCPHDQVVHRRVSDSHARCFCDASAPVEMRAVNRPPRQRALTEGRHLAVILAVLDVIYQVFGFVGGYMENPFSRIEEKDPLQ